MIGREISPIMTIVGVICYYIIVHLIADTIGNSNLHGTKYRIDELEGERGAKRPIVEVRNATYHGSGPREEARAMCSVNTHEINATANATITRRLHGVVTSRELQIAIQRLEVIIFGQMQQVWKSLDTLGSQLAGNAYSVYPDRHKVVLRYNPRPN